MNLLMKVPIEKVSAYLADLYRAVSTAMYFVMAEKRGLDLRELGVTTANDLLAQSTPNLLNHIPSPFQERHMPRIG
jgi:methylmalonyl-CoA mutase N-terminal domain/subunit